jgi:hypothetical protein
MSTERRIKARRRIAMRFGLILIVLASATACIFDQSEYKGGGRLDKGATAATASSSATATDSVPTDDPTSRPPQQDAASVLDAGTGAGG